MYDRYRIVVNSAIMPGVYYGFSEIAMFTVVGGANACVGGTPFSQNFLSSTYLPARAFDGSDSTQWRSDAIGLTEIGTRVGGRLIAGFSPIGYQFTSAVNIVEVGLKFSANCILYDVFIEASNDGINWVKKAWVKEINMTANVVYPISIPTNPTFDFKSWVNIGTIFRKGILYDEPVRGLKVGQTYKMRQHYGKYRISGTTTTTGYRVARMVYLIDTLSGEVLESQWSGEQGEYNFVGLKKMNYTVMGVDRSIEQNSIVFAHIEAVE